MYVVNNVENMDGITRMEEIRESDLEKIEETVTWLKDPTDEIYVKIHSTAYRLRKRAEKMKQ